MIITKKIAETLIDKHKLFAPNKAKVILIHKVDGRVFFAEKFEQGCKFWSADNMRESTLQGIIHKLEIVAKRNDQGDWVAMVDFSSKVEPPKAPKTRMEKIAQAQELVSKKSGSGTSVTIKRTPLKYEKPDSMESPAVAVDPVDYGAVDDPKLPAPVSIQDQADPFAGFYSIRSLQTTGPKIAAPSITLRRKTGVVYVNPLIRDKIGVNNEFDVLVNDGEIYFVKGRPALIMKQRGSFNSVRLCNLVDFKGRESVSIMFEWKEELQAFYGKFDKKEKE